MKVSSRSVLLLFAGCVVVSLPLFVAACGDDDDDGEETRAFVSGNVSSVTGQTARLQVPRQGWLARLFAPSRAIAQACTATDVLACVNNGTTEDCNTVNSTSCEFSLAIDGRTGELSVRFVADADADGAVDEGENDAALIDSLGPICAGIRITLNDVAVNFTLGTADAASVTRSGSCDPTPVPPTPTTPAGTPAPSPTATPQCGPPGTATCGDNLECCSNSCNFATGFCN